MNSLVEENRKMWFAMSAPYRRELKAKEILDSIGVENFVPMTKSIIERGGQKRRATVPAIHNLIFVRATKEQIKEIKARTTYLQYRTFPCNGKNCPITVPDKEMQQFITITQERMDEITYLKPEEIDIAKGTRVRIHGGAFNGTEGIFVKVKGKRNRRVVVHIDGIASIAINTEIAPEFIEVIEHNQ